MEIMETADKIDLHLLHSFKVAITNQHVRDENSFSRLELTKGDTTKGSMITGESGRIISGKKEEAELFSQVVVSGGLAGKKFKKANRFNSLS